MVGGIAAENFGSISGITLESSQLIVEGRTFDTGEREGVAGIYTGYNGAKGNITLEADIQNVVVDSSGRYTGGVVGVNKGRVINSKTSEGLTDNIVIAGSISGDMTVGSLIGLNKSEDSSLEIYGFTNQSSVIAVNGNAGGIIGENDSSNTIRGCVNYAVVTASDAGNAGGITSVNDGMIIDCYDYQTVSAPEGMCGGITALNELNGSIKGCYVESKEADTKIVFRSTKSVGAVAAQNSGYIYGNKIKNVQVTNETTKTSASIGIIAGDNLATGIIELAPDSATKKEIENSQAIAQSNYCKVGGIAGTNAGIVRGSEADNPEAIASVVTCELVMNKASIASMGGAVGKNTGLIEDIAVDAKIQGNLGSSDTGYGGIAGYSGYASVSEASSAKGNSLSGDDDYPALITNCTFDGIINASGSSGSPVRIGGIAGVNAYGSKVYSCHIGVRTDVAAGQSDETYVTAGDYEHKTAESVSKTDTSSYANLGGIAGDNYGCILACNNADKSSDTVYIIGFAGETGGIAGYNGKYGIVTGYLDPDNNKEYYLSTGKMWTVEQRCCGNDRGPGGIIGMSESAEDMSYVINYAPVTCAYQSNNYASGFIGMMNQQYKQKPRIYKCDNYGDIYSTRSASGFVGLIKSNGIYFEECNNYGNVYAKDENAGGFVARHHSFVIGLEFRHCKNNGNITCRGTVGGFVGKQDYNLSWEDSYIYDCVNTGIIKRENATAVSGNAGDFVGKASSKIYMELCRNYNTYTSAANGFVGSGTSYLKNCFDDSNIITTSTSKSPFGGGVNNGSNAYYLDSASESTFSHKNYGVYFSLHQGANGSGKFADLRYNNFYYKNLRNTSYYFSEPGISNQIVMYTSNPSLKISLTYDESSRGIDSFVMYFWNGNNNRGSASAGSYTCKATYIYMDGTTREVSAGPVVGYYDICNESRMVLQNPDSDKKPVSIMLDFSGNTPTRLRGFSYIPAEDTTAEAVCTYLSEKNGVAFSIDGLRVAGGSLQSNFSYRNKPATDIFYNEYPNDALDIDWTDYSNFGMKCSTGQMVDITLNVANDDDATGMDEFVFYLANANTNSNAAQSARGEKYYNYYVTFTDIKGNTVDTEPVQNAAGYDSGVENYRTKSRQEVSIPDGLDGRITSIVLHIQPVNNANVYFRGFAWIPEGQSEQKMAAQTHAGATNSVTDRDITDSGAYLTHLMVDKSGTKAYVYTPYNYNKGFYMSETANDPIGNTYYSDYSVYADSITETLNSGSRMDVYMDIDPKMTELSEDICTVYRKLNTPTGLKMVEGNGCISFSWNKVIDAYSYEIHYVIRDKSDNVIYDSGYETIGSIQRSYDIELDEGWSKQSCRIDFSVRAINGYHPDHDDITAGDYDENYDRYDSDLAQINEIVVHEALPKPEVHIEIIAGNRAVFVLDNYDKYVEEGCTDCIVKVSYNGTDYSWNVADTGKYSTPVTLSAPNNNGLAKYLYYAVPNDSLKDIYTNSSEYSQAGEAHANNVLAGKQSYCDTKFYGFYGTEADSMEYRTVFTLSSMDVYLMTDISAYDAEVGATVVYDSEITHAANSYSGGGSLMLTSTLKNLPMKWFAEDSQDKITVRAYPYHSQFDIIHYGHDVEEGIILDGTAEENQAVLAGIFDKCYFGADSMEPVENCIWDAETNDLKSGYLLLKQEDGTYNVYYSALIELSQTAAKQRREENLEPYREYYMYDVYYRIYSNMAAETSGEIVANSADMQESYWSRGEWYRDYVEAYNTVNTDNNLRTHIQEIQSAPKLEDEVIEQVDAEGHNTYTFKWDKYYLDTACWSNGYTENGYRASELMKITNPPETLFETWDMYRERYLHSGLESTDISNNSTARQVMQRAMNAYYNSYSSASYRVDLIGTTLDGREVMLDSVTVDTATSLGTVDSVTDQGGAYITPTTGDGITATTYQMWDYECTFTDKNNVWGNYPRLTARVMRLGGLSSVKAYNYNNGNSRTDRNSATYILPRYAEKSIQIKIKMNTISKPRVELNRINGQYITDDLVYEVEWGAITDEKQKEDLGGYLITVKQTNASVGNAVPVHYYYVRDVADASDTMGLDISELEAQGIVTDVTGDYTRTGDSCKTLINLSDFETGALLEISVKAVARTNAVIYEDGAEGVKTELNVPDRLKVPEASKLSVYLAQQSETGTFDYSIVPDENTTVSMEQYKKGFGIKYDTSDYADETTTKLVLAVAVYDSRAGEEADKSRITTVWNEGAVKTLYAKDKDNVFSLGMVTEDTFTVMDITSFEAYPGEYAGKWLKIALCATSTTKIDSQWSDVDPADKTVNYVWIPVPKLQLDDVELSEGSVPGAEDIVRYYYKDASNNEGLYNESQDVNYETPLSTKTLNYLEDKNVDGYHIQITGKEVPSNVEQIVPVYDLYLQRHINEAVGDFDGTWDVYLYASGITDAGSNGQSEQQSSESHPVCEQDGRAVWLGIFGAPFEPAENIEVPDINQQETNTARDLIDISNVKMSFADSDVEYKDITLQLRFSVIDGKGIIQLVLPDITQIGESLYAGDYFTSKVEVSQYLRTGRSCISGQKDTYQREND